MIVNRRTFMLKKGRRQEAVALFKSSPWPPARILSPATIGPFDVLAVEWEDKSLADYAKSTTEAMSSDEAAMFNEKLNELLVPGGGSEVWQVE